MNVLTAAELKKAVAQKLEIGKNGYEATLKANTPDEAVSLVVKTHLLYLARKDQLPEGIHPAPATVLIHKADGTYEIQRIGGEAVPYDPEFQAAEEGYRVKIAVVQNTKSFGWKVTVKDPSPDVMMAIIDYTEDLLRKAFAVAEETKAG